MPNKIVKRGDKYRVVEKATGRVVKNRAGTAIDGGGHKSKAKAQAQSIATNISYARKKGHRIPKKR